MITDALPGILLGAVLASGALLPAGWLAVRRARRRAAPENPPGTAADIRVDVLSTAPDGIFAWIRRPQTVSCSQTLVNMLNLAGGTAADYDEVRAAFPNDDRALLDDAVAGLRETGRPFGLLLRRAGRTYQVAGRRAQGGGSQPAADVLWFRDVTALIADNAGTGDDDGNDGDRLRAIFDALPIPLWLRDPDLDLAFANRAAGGAEGALAGRAGEIAGQALRDMRATTERRMVGDNGSRRVVEITEAPLGPGAGTVGYAIDHDTADRDAMENALMRERVAFDQMLDSLTSAVAVYDSARRLRSYNAAFADTWSLDEAWLEGAPSLSQVLDRLRETRRLPEVPDFAAYRAEENALFDSLDTPTERMLHLPDGRTLRNVVAPTATGGLMFAYDDITDRLSLQRSYKTLDAVQRQTIDNLQEAVAVFGSDGRLKLHNAPFARLFGLDGAAADGDADRTEAHLTDVLAAFRNDGEDDAAWTGRRRHIAGAITRRASSTGRTTGPGDVVLDYANVPLPDGAVLVSYLDVTDSAKVEAALRARAEALEEAGRLKSKFIANVSHEVRTPLTTVIGFAEILAQRYFGELTPRQSEYVDGILGSARGLMTVVGDILDLAQVEAGVMALETDAVDLHALLAGSMKLIRESARQKDLHLEFDVPPDIGWVHADERRLGQVVLNLLQNAVQFTPARGGVRLSASRDGDTVAFAVADTGVGIPQADIDRVFGTFETGGEAAPRDGGGAGLGLALVKSFVELHGGNVNVRSVPNRGTTVTCSLPEKGPDGGDARDAFQV